MQGLFLVGEVWDMPQCYASYAGRDR